MMSQGRVICFPIFFVPKPLRWVRVRPLMRVRCSGCSSSWTEHAPPMSNQKAALPLLMALLQVQDLSPGGSVPRQQNHGAPGILGL